jgi:hypothetical protein
MGDEDYIILRRPKPRGSRKPVPSEAQIQTAIRARLQWLGCLVMSIPNEGKRSVIAGRRMKSTGLSAGAPDLLIYRHGKHALIEVKSDTGRLSPAQVEMHTRLAKQGWTVHVVRSQDEAVRALESEGWSFTR